MGAVNLEAAVSLFLSVSAACKICPSPLPGESPGMVQSCVWCPTELVGAQFVKHRRRMPRPWMLIDHHSYWWLVTFSQGSGWYPDGIIVLGILLWWTGNQILWVMSCVAEQVICHTNYITQAYMSHPWLCCLFIVCFYFFRGQSAVRFNVPLFLGEHSSFCLFLYLLNLSCSGAFGNPGGVSSRSLERGLHYVQVMSISAEIFPARTSPGQAERNAVCPWPGGAACCVQAQGAGWTAAGWAPQRGCLRLLSTDLMLRFFTSGRVLGKQQKCLSSKPQHFCVIISPEKPASCFQPPCPEAPPRCPAPRRLWQPPEAVAAPPTPGLPAPGCPTPCNTPSNTPRSHPRQRIPGSPPPAAHPRQRIPGSPPPAAHPAAVERVPRAACRREPSPGRGRRQCWCQRERPQAAALYCLVFQGKPSQRVEAQGISTIFPQRRPVPCPPTHPHRLGLRTHTLCCFDVISSKYFATERQCRVTGVL